VLISVLFGSVRFGTRSQEYIGSECISEMDTLVKVQYGVYSTVQ